MMADTLYTTKEVSLPQRFITHTGEQQLNGRDFSFADNLSFKLHSIDKFVVCDDQKQIWGLSITIDGVNNDIVLTQHTPIQHYLAAMIPVKASLIRIG